MKRGIFITAGLLTLLLAGCSAQEEPVPDVSTIEEPPSREPALEGPPVDLPPEEPAIEEPPVDIPPEEPAIDEPPVDIPPPPPPVVSPPELSVPGIVAKSGSAIDIQAAANAVYLTGGGTVYIPEGDFFLDGSVTIRSNIKLVGAGTDKTTLRTRGPLMMIRARGENIRITGFSLISDDHNGGNGIVVEDSVDFRVDHLRIEGYSDQAAVFVSGSSTWGVIDHNLIKNKAASRLNYGVVVYGDDTWKEDAKLGTRYAVFIEDNTFTNTRHAVAANKGAHYVFRYNHVNGGVAGQAVDAHGPYYGGNEGTRAFEVYGNVIESPQPSGSERAIGIRGGSGVIFNNTIRGYTFGVMLMMEDSQDLSSYPAYHQVRDVYIWDNSCDGENEVIVQRNNNARQFIKEDRDFFLSPQDGYKPYSYPHPLTLD